MDERKTYNISLIGRSFKLSSTENEEHVQRVAKMAENSMSETMMLDKRISFETAAPVTALRFSEEIIRLQDDLTRLRRELADARNKDT